MRKVSGFSLPSVLIASSLSMFITAMLCQSFLVLKRLWADQQAYQQTQAALQTLQWVFHHRIQHAGDYLEHLHVEDNSELSALLASGGIQIDDQERLSVVYSEPPIEGVLKGQRLSLSSPVGIYQESGWVLGNSQNSRLVRIRPSNRIQSDVFLLESAGDFQGPVWLGKLRWYRYSTRLVSRGGSSEQFTGALFQEQKGHRTDALVEGIKTMTWSYVPEGIKLSVGIQVPAIQAPCIHWENQWALSPNVKQAPS